MAEKPPMAVSVKCTGVTIATNGHVFVNWDDGSQTEYQSVPDMLNQSVELDSDKNLARKLLIGDWMRTDPGGLNPATIVNKTCVVNALAASKISIV